MKILGIETSCDETAIALIDASGEFEHNFKFKTLGNALLSQAKEHAQYGGVFPNVAKREHGRNLVPVLMETLRQGDMLMDSPVPFDDVFFADLHRMLERESELYTYLSQFLREHGKPDVDAIAVTVGPGLEPALWVGINFAKALAKAWDVPIVPVDHMEGHIVISALWDRNDEDKRQKAKGKIEFPLLSLLISGGHTELLLSREWMQYELLGQTRDDAVGEAFDKVARLMGLPYPGGPHISALAEMSRKNAEHTQNDAEEIPRGSASVPHRSALSLPRPMIDSPNYDLSFAGLKTAVRRLVEECRTRHVLHDAMKGEIAREFEDACADVLVAKTMRAVEEHDVNTIVVGGGVSANEHIRAQLTAAIKDYGLNTKLLIPPPELATDNALMIAIAGYFRALRNEYKEPGLINAKGNQRLAA